MELNKYKNQGWGLSKSCFEDLLKIIKDINDPTIVEFGSGISTSFFIDFFNENKTNGRIYSFDNDREFCSKISDEKLNLKLCNLVECNDEVFNDMFKYRQYFPTKMSIKKSKPTTRQKNTFYDIVSNDLPNNIDLVILDGPHGNGRSIAFLHLINKLNSGAHVLIDDFNHYDFVKRFKEIFEDSELVFELNNGNDNKWETGGNYKIFKIK